MSTYEQRKKAQEFVEDRLRKSGVDPDTAHRESLRIAREHDAKNPNTNPTPKKKDG